MKMVEKVALTEQVLEVKLLEALIVRFFEIA